MEIQQTGAQKVDGQTDRPMIDRQTDEQQMERQAEKHMEKHLGGRTDRQGVPPI